MPKCKNAKLPVHQQPASGHLPLPDEVALPCHQAQGLAALSGVDSRVGPELADVQVGHQLGHLQYLLLSLMLVLILLSTCSLERGASRKWLTLAMTALRSAFMSS